MNIPQQHRLVGQVIADRYRVEQLLGQGGMGAVYVAEHLTLHKKVALKVVHPEHAGNAELAARFAREAMATSRIDHPNVISAIDFGTLADGTAYLAVQFVRGPSLTKVLDTEGRLRWTRAADIGAQIADALCAAQVHGIVHRDLKPDNVLLQPLDDGGELVKVLDFGVAKFSRESQVPMVARAEVTQMGLIVGTPGYMAPEQAIGNPADHRSDLYSLGVLLWEATVGKPLWRAEDLQALVQRQLGEDPPRLRVATQDPDIPEEYEDLVDKLLARRAEDRPNDPALVRDQLRELVAMSGERRGGSGARLLFGRTPPSSASITVPVTVPPPTPAASISTRVKALRPRSSRSAWLLTLLVTTILGAGVFLVATGQITVKPQGQVAEVAHSVARELNLPPPVLEALKPEEQVGPSGLPSALEPVFEKLIAADDRDERVSAADLLLAHQPLEQVPPYVRRVAYLQIAKTCPEKRTELEELAQIADTRSLPVLVRMAQKPRNGCGRRHREDCLGCLRAELAQLIDKLEHESPAIR